MCNRYGFNPSHVKLTCLMNSHNFIYRGRKASLEGNVYTLVQCDRQEPILLFEDGRISRSSSPNDYLCDRHDKKIIWADSIKQGKKRVVCVVTQGVKGLEALVYVIEKKSQSIQPQKIMLHGKNNKRVTLCETFILERKMSYLYNLISKVLIQIHVLL